MPLKPYKESAFPCPVPGHDGMSLRDYFAAKAMAAYISDVEDPEKVAAWAYENADAMLKAREKDVQR